MLRVAGLTVGVALILSSLIISCGEDKPTNGSTGGDPTACFVMSMELEEDALCAYQYEFILDPTCSSDDETSTNDLECRWDYENDGQWDTDFDSLRTDDDYTPEPTDEVWVARLQIRDLDGNVSEVVDSMALGPFPTSPDLIAGSILFNISGGSPDEWVDTVHAGEPFGIMVYETCFGDFLDPDHSTQILRDGVPFDTSTGACSGSLFGCGGGSTGDYVIDIPGTYEFTAVYDFEDVYAETDETNNTASATLTVIPNGSAGSLVSSWQCVFYSEDGVEVEKDMVVEFRADGTGNWGNENISWQTAGNSMTISWLDEGGHESNMNYDLDGDSLTITAYDDYDLVFVFERISG